MDENLIKYGQQDFSLPHDVVELPTKGKFYKSKKKSVKVGYLTAADENLIMGTNTDDLVMTLLRNKVYEPDLRPEDMLNGDIEAILIFLRNTSFGPEYKVSVLDPQTNKRFQADIMLDELKIKETTVQPSEDGSFDITLPKSQVSVKVRPLTFKEQQEINKMAETYPAGRVAPRVTWRLQKQIVSVNGDSDQGVINRFVDGLPIMDSKYIRTFINENEPQLDLRKTIIAPSGEKVDVEIAFGVEFFRVFF